MLKSAAIALALGLSALVTTQAYADPSTNGAANKPETAGQQYELVDGTSFDNAGAMLQHLRDRDNGFAAGNPKEIVEAYPEEFETVGDLIHQKRTN